jgi:hypothetical protein
VAQAYSIDAKVDDGFPQTGTITATYINQYIVWSGGPNLEFGQTNASAKPGSATTCYDNGNVVGATQIYSVEISNGSNVN